LRGTPGGTNQKKSQKRKIHPFQKKRGAKQPALLREKEKNTPAFQQEGKEEKTLKRKGSLKKKKGPPFS